MSGPNATLLDLVLELQLLDRVPRAGYLLRGIADGESVAEHSFHLAMIVRLLAPREPGLDAGRAVELALLHDLGELRIGDLPANAARYFPDGAKHVAEQRAVEELLAPDETSAQARYREYEERATREARFVAACDKLQMMIKVSVYQRQGRGGLAEFWLHAGNFPGTEFAAVRELFDSLRARFGPRPASG